jgi:hypothetical protein
MVQPPKETGFGPIINALSRKHNVIFQPNFHEFSKKNDEKRKSKALPIVFCKRHMEGFACVLVFWKSLHSLSNSCES